VIYIVSVTVHAKCYQEENPLAIWWKGGDFRSAESIHLGRSIGGAIWRKKYIQNYKEGEFAIIG